VSDDTLPPPSDSCARCAALAQTEKRNSGRAATPERCTVFLETLRKTASISAASEAATPWSSAEGAGESTFRDLRRRDAAFAAEWDAALAGALGDVESALMRRALEPTSRPVFSKGELVGQELKYDNQLLLRVATRLNPEWSDRSKVTHDGEVQHRLDVRGAFLSLQAADVLLLPRDEQERLIALVGKIRDAKKLLPPDTDDGSDGTD
jgi:hypothetical protein